MIILAVICFIINATKPISSTRRSLNCSYSVLQTSTLMHWCVAQRAQILSLSASGGCVHSTYSSHSIEMNVRKCSVLPLADLGYPWVDSMICRVYKAPSVFLFTEHPTTPTGYLKLILVPCLHRHLRRLVCLEASLMLIRLVFAKLILWDAPIAVNGGGEGFGFA